MPVSTTARRPDSDRPTIEISRQPLSYVQAYRAQSSHVPSPLRRKSTADKDSSSLVRESAHWQRRRALHPVAEPPWLLDGFSVDESCDVPRPEFQSANVSSQI